MGIMKQHVLRIGQGVKLFDPDSTLDVAIVGYPNTHTDAGTVATAFGKQVEQDTTPDYNMIRLFKAHGSHNVRVFDVEAHRGIEEFLDLNNALPSDLTQAFDCVIDSSCLEHCFNIAQAFRNLCDMTRVGGFVATVAPIYIFNHGYYNVNPIMHQDGFAQNGFELLAHELIDNSGEIVRGFSGKKSDPRAPRTFILTLAKKIVQQEFKWPIQTHKGLGVKYE
jgi:SAM-dependent methyltransferase